MPEEKEVFAFLDSIRESGDINMYAAAPVIVEVYGVDKQEARTLLKMWMRQFGRSEL